MADNNLQDLDPSAIKAGETAEVNYQGAPQNPAGVWRHKETGAEIIALSTPKYGSPQADAFKRIGFEYVRPAEAGEIKHRSAALLVEAPERTEQESVESLKARLATAEAERDVAIAHAKVADAAQADIDDAAKQDAARAAAAQEAVAAAGQAKAILDEQAGAAGHEASTSNTSDLTEATDTESAEKTDELADLQNDVPVGDGDSTSAPLDETADTTNADESENK